LDGAIGCGAVVVCTVDDPASIFALMYMYGRIV
jgi:hypothetical protein